MSLLERLDTIGEIRDYVRLRKTGGATIAFVPTMGALHDGHRSCVEVARRIGRVVVVSIFVNPAQFGPGEDLSRYPRPLHADLELCERWGVDAVFMPSTEEIYPVEQRVWVEVEGLTAPLCGRSRAGHFRGVATVVLKLFNIVEPDSAVFGQKDAQQAVVIREMAAELDLPVRIALSPTVREADGLAMSSRNAYLSPDERVRATGIYDALRHGSSVLSSGVKDPEEVVGAVRHRLESRGITDVEYVELLNVRDLSPPSRAEGRLLLAVAARVGATRLIDNLCLEVRADGVVEEAMLF